MDHPVLLLQWTFHQQEPAARHHETVLFENVWGDDYVGDTGLVLQRQKHETFDSSGPLASDDTARDLHGLVVSAGQLIGRKDPFRKQQRAFCEGSRTCPGFLSREKP